MVARKTYYISTILCLCMFYCAFGQDSCFKSKIIGDWEYLSSEINHSNLSLDTIIKYTRNSKVIGTWTFNADDKYFYKSQLEKYKSKGRYYTIEDKCEIRLGSKTNTSDGKFFYILYLDDKYLITKCTKPKGAFIYVHRRKNP